MPVPIGGIHGALTENILCGGMRDVTLVQSVQVIERVFMMEMIRETFIGLAFSAPGMPFTTAWAPCLEGKPDQEDVDGNAYRRLRHKDVCYKLQAGWTRLGSGQYAAE